MAKRQGAAGATGWGVGVSNLGQQPRSVQRKGAHAGGGETLHLGNARSVIRRSHAGPQGLWSDRDIQGRMSIGRWAPGGSKAPQATQAPRLALDGRALDGRTPDTRTCTRPGGRLHGLLPAAPAQLLRAVARHQHVDVDAHQVTHAELGRALACNSNGTTHTKPVASAPASAAGKHRTLCVCATCAHRAGWARAPGAETCRHHIHSLHKKAVHTEATHAACLAP